MVNTIDCIASNEESLNKVDFNFKSLAESLPQVYSSEKQWHALLPILQLAVGCEDLMETLNKFEKEGKHHLHRLESIFREMHVEIVELANKDVEVLVEECYDMIDVTPRNSFIRDAGLIVGMQQLQQYQITAYTSLLAQAITCEAEKIVNLLRVIIHHKQQEVEQLAMAGTSQMLDELT